MHTGAHVMTGFKVHTMHSAVPPQHPATIKLSTPEVHSGMPLQVL